MEVHPDTQQPFDETPGIDLRSIFVLCAGWFGANLAQARVILEKETSIEEMLPQIGLWASLWMHN